MSTARIPAWAGPLDVAELALGAVREAGAATERLLRAHGTDVQVTTHPALVEAAFSAIDRLRVDGRAAEPWAPLSGFAAARDGWLRLHGNYPHHATAITAALGARTPEELAAAVAPRPAEEAAARVIRAGGIAAVVRTPEEWRAHPHARATAGDLWVTTQLGGMARDESPDPAATGERLPLAGRRVLDLTRVVAGPVATQLLGCLGADVLRLDPPARPEQLDAFLAAGMGKRSALLDLRAHRDLLEELLAGTDVVVLGYRPGALTDVGLDPSDLAARHPHLVIGALSAWGERGPWGDRAGFDSIVQAATGIAVRCAREDGRPGALPVQALDHATGFRLAAGMLDLLADGRAGVVRASLLGAARTLLATGTGATSSTGAGDGDGRAEADGGAGDGAAVGLPPAVELGTPHGRVSTVPVPLLLDGVPLTGAISGYGTAPPRWEERR
ncbi:CoA transferase [Brachybacterium sp. SGAir0954]|uniref:CoA transferase n=1 Tax=Brachybacterium sp. SGAir0954 TaxID=2571029 RepID=UPI0010CD0473|nr:CoA transferase [Brachybacterium sp. SGAir0954]QCR52727.1 CoA transferase [Brachybacterium sp. SGAir0954]